MILSLPQTFFGTFLKCNTNYGTSSIFLENVKFNKTNTNRKELQKRKEKKEWSPAAQYNKCTVPSAQPPAHLNLSTTRYSSHRRGSMAGYLDNDEATG